MMSVFKVATAISIACCMTIVPGFAKEATETTEATEATQKPEPEANKPSETPLAIDLPNGQLPALPPQQSERIGLSIWGGLGFNYHTYSQKTSALGLDVKYETLRSPSYYLESAYKFEGGWRVFAKARLTPGVAKSSSSVELEKGKVSYIWYTYELEFAKLPKTYDFFGKQLEFGVRFGLQHHVVPFLVYRSLGVVGMSDNDLTMISLGPLAVVSDHGPIAYETFLRYQHPVAAGTKFSPESSLAFDGSVGAIFKWNQKWKMGLFWYGQYHKYSLAGSGGTRDTLHLFYSSLELRGAYTF